MRIVSESKFLKRRVSILALALTASVSLVSFSAQQACAASRGVELEEKMSAGGRGVKYPLVLETFRGDMTLYKNWLECPESMRQGNALRFFERDSLLTDLTIDLNEQSNIYDRPGCGIITFVAAFKDNDTLTSLSIIISGSAAGNATYNAALFGGALERNRTLTRLDLSAGMNGYNPLVLRSFARAIECNRTLNKLNLSFSTNHRSDPDLVPLIVALRGNWTLTDMNVSSSPGSGPLRNDVFNEFNELLARNKYYQQRKQEEEQNGSPKITIVPQSAVTTMARNASVNNVGKNPISVVSVANPNPFNLFSSTSAPITTSTRINSVNVTSSAAAIPSVGIISSTSEDANLTPVFSSSRPSSTSATASVLPSNKGSIQDEIMDIAQRIKNNKLEAQTLQDLLKQKKEDWKKHQEMINDMMFGLLGDPSDSVGIPGQK